MPSSKRGKMNITYLLYCFVLSSRSNWPLFSQINFPPPQTAANRCWVEYYKATAKKGAFEKDVLTILMSQTLFFALGTIETDPVHFGIVSTFEIRQPHGIALLNTYIACEHFFQHNLLPTDEWKIKPPNVTRLFCTTSKRYSLHI